MQWIANGKTSWVAAIVCAATAGAAELPFPPELSRAAPITMAELAKRKTDGVCVVEVSDYLFGNYQGDLTSPPSADLNPRTAFIIFWKDVSFRFVFSHEASYCPWFELPAGAGVSFQFMEGNDGWAELMNQWGRQEKNSFIDVLESGPRRVWVRWTYFGVHVESGQPAYRASEDFWAYPNGLILRRQRYRTLRPGKHEGYTREPVELIGMCPVGKRWFDVLEKDPAKQECHALAVLDAFSSRRYDVWWTPKSGTLWDSTPRRTGCKSEELDDSAGVVLALPMNEGWPFCVFGDASGFRHDYTRLKEHTFTAEIWGSTCWDHWPIGWVNSQGHVMDEKSFRLYPNCFSPMGMDFFALPNEIEEQGIYYSLYGIGVDAEAIRGVARRWLEKGTAALVQPDSIADLPAAAGAGRPDGR